ncbi:S8 family serine peptidase [Fulvivirgaceae bacterium PWU4]|uniref:S8 family serine peptidase n=1 Tax=Chryseosolibacter histidini TaxID=2782349 RepID=A0AAP2DL25_9BACT|nr:S8 family serine peptidase [Chryseosolibacter histidini]MBT1695849.1 S8 family serine peptidase [Chryseosolibacter histidini]
MFAYKVKGKKHQLDYSDKFVVIRTKENKPLAASLKKKSSKDLVANLEPFDEYPHKGVYIMKVKEAAKKTIPVRNDVRKQLKTENKIRFAGRALEDPRTGKPVIYTENIVIKFKKDVVTEEIDKLLKSKNLTVSAQQNKMNVTTLLDNVYVVKVPEGSGAEVVFDTVNDLSKHASVEYAYPELITKRKFKVVVSPQQWHLKETQINGTDVRANISVEDAWRISKGKDVTIAIIDDGVDITHPEFSGKVVYPYDATLRTKNPKPKYKDENHGTACAGVACAAGVKAAGVAPEATLMPIRLSSNLGSIEEAEAFAWAIKNGAHIISCSWGPADGEWWNQSDDGDEYPLPELTREIIDKAVTEGRNGKGTIVLFAAGNGNENIEADGYSSNDQVIAVAACNDTNRRSVYSDYGKSVFCCFPSNDFEHEDFNHPAPLTNGIYTTDRRGENGYSRKNYTDDFGGTSSATPGVAGVIALMLSANPNLTIQQVKKILKDTCDKIDKPKGQYDSKGHSIFYGYGKVNAAKAVSAAAKTGKKKKVKK